MSLLTLIVAKENVLGLQSEYFLLLLPFTLITRVTACDDHGSITKLQELQV
jgi:hypothetical protein